jgi:hypothetical protein
MITPPLRPAPNGVLQIAYTVPSIEEAALAYVDRLGIGPWLVRGPFQSPKARYRGQPSTLSLTIGITFSGPLMLELIQQHNDAPSVYLDGIRKHGFGFHHWGIACEHFDQEVEAYRQQGRDIVFSDETPSGARVAYFDTADQLPGMIELIEMTDAQKVRYAKIQAETIAWDRTNPIRHP